MSNNDIRAALERLVNFYDRCQGEYEELWPEFMDEPFAAARAALAAAPEGEPSDDELLEMGQLHCISFTLSDGTVVSPYQEGTDMRPEVLSYARAVLARWGRPSAPPAPLVDLPPDYIDEWITNPRDRSLLEVFHKACNSEGGSADEVILRGLKAVLHDDLSRSHRLQQENYRFREPERTILCDILANRTLLPDPDGTRYGIPATPPAPLEGEVGELVAFLTPSREQAGAITFEAFCKLRRAATLLSHLPSAAAPAVVPVAVAERLPREGDCDAEGRCWRFHPEDDSQWNVWSYSRSNGQETHWLPAHAIPLPTPQDGEVEA